MEAGRLREWITIRAYTSTQARAGDVSKEPVVLATVWAAWIPAGVVERERADRTEAQETGAFIIRYRGDVTSKNDILWRGNVWQILGVVADDKRTQIELTVERVT